RVFRRGPLPARRRESRYSRSWPSMRGASLALTIWKAPESTARRELGARVRPRSGQRRRFGQRIEQMEGGAGRRASYSLTKSPGLAYIAVPVAAFSRLLFFPGGGVVFRR